nr:RHS repeat-associated core domain-containing protein [Caldalkalibacillus salinus]
MFNGTDYEGAKQWIEDNGVNLLTGNYLEEHTDITIKSSGLDLDIGRTYNSSEAGNVTVLGDGWRTSYDSFITKTSEYGFVTASTLNVRDDKYIPEGSEQASSSVPGEVIGQVSYGTIIEVQGTVTDSNGRTWYQISHNGGTGYVASWYVTTFNDIETARITYPSGTEIPFFEEDQVNNETTYTSPYGVYDTLVKRDGAYILTRQDQSQFIYDETSGKLVGKKDKYGNRITIEYHDEYDKIKRVYDNVDRKLVMSYNDAGQMTQVQEYILGAPGRAVQYDYEGDYLVSVTDLEGHITRYLYTDSREGEDEEETPEADKKQLLHRVIDANGHQVVRNEYDTFDRLIKRYDGLEHVKLYIYDDINKARYVIDENGQEQKVTYNQELKPVEEINSIGGKKQYTYEVKYNGEWHDLSQYDTDDTQDNEEYKDIRSENRPTRVTVQEVVKREKQDDGTVVDSFRTIVREYDANHNLVSHTDPIGRKTTMEYNDQNQLTSETNPRGHTTSYEYDEDGIHLLTETDPLGHATEYLYYSSTAIKGLVKQIKDKRGNVTQYQYNDAFHNRTKIIDPLNRVTENIYYNIGLLRYEKDPKGYTTSFQYDKMGRTKVMTDAKGETIHYDYDDVGNKVKEIDRRHNVTTYRYNEKNQRTKKIDAKGNVTTYRYDPVGNKVQEIDALGATTTFRYDDVHRLVEEIQSVDDERTISTHYEYDYADRLLRETVGDRLQVSNVYDDADQLRQVYDANGNVEIYDYDANGNIKSYTNKRGYTTSYEYDALDRQTKETDPQGNVYETHYDANGNVTGEEDPLGRYAKMTYDEANQLITEETFVQRDEPIDDTFEGTYKSTGVKNEYRYDANGNVKEEIDALNRVTTYDYDELNQLTLESRTHEESGEVQAIEYRYDANGNQTHVIDAKGNITETMYDELNREQFVYDAKRNKTEYRYDAVGNHIFEIDAAGYVWEQEYNDLGWVTAEVNPEGDRTEYTYDDFGNVLTEQLGTLPATEYKYTALQFLKRIIRPYGNVESFEYDVHGNERLHYDEDGHVTEYQYNALDQHVKTINPVDPDHPDQPQAVFEYRYDAVGNKVLEIDGKGGQWEYKYDHFDRLEKEIDPERHVTSYEYDLVGNKEAEVDANGNRIEFDYDSLDRLEAVKEGETGIVEVSYTYDLNDNVETQTNGEGHTTTYRYDSLNQRTDIIDPEEKVEHYTYDAVGNIDTKTDRNGVITDYTYDGVGQLTSEVAGDETISYEYELGERVKMVDASGETNYRRDYNNRLDLITYPDGSQVEYRYNSRDLRSMEKVIIGDESHTVFYEYDELKRLKHVMLGDSTRTTTYTYDDNGNRETQTLYNGMHTSYEYDGRNLLTKLRNQFPASSGAEDQIFEYGYYPNGTQEYKIEPKGKTSFTYDTWDRVTTIEEPNGHTTTYTYDRAGNRETQIVKDAGGAMISDITYSYESRNRLEQAVDTVENTTVEYGYDANGNQLTVTTNGGEPDVYTYNNFNQLTSSQTAAGDISYTYNGDGYRVGKTDGQGTTTYLYSDDKVAAEIDGSGMVHHQTYGHNLIHRQVGQADMLFYVYNGHADVMQVTDYEGNILNTYDYDIFGHHLVEEETIANPYRYAGYVYDSELEYYYLNARYYDPEIARFITEDTYRGEYTDPLSLNLYTYGHNNPIRYHDPTGHFIQFAVGAVVGVATTAAFDVGMNLYKHGWNASDWEFSSSAEYASAAVGGAVSGGISNVLKVGKAVSQTLAVGATSGAADNVTRQSIEIAQGERSEFSLNELMTDMVLSAGSDAVGTQALKGFNKGTNDTSRQVLNSVDDTTTLPAVNNLTEGTGKVDDFAKEPFLPDEYYKNNYAPIQGTPGARIDFSRLGSSGKVENSRVIYDQAGKQKYRIDYTDHGNSFHHTNPHMHEYIYQDAGKSVKAEIKYFMDFSTGRLRQGIIDGKTNKIKFID